MVRTNGFSGVLVCEQRREAAVSDQPCDGVVQVTRVPAVRWSLLRGKGIHVLKMRSAGVQALTVDYQMLIVADAHLLAAHRDHPFNVEVVA